MVVRRCLMLDDLLLLRGLINDRIHVCIYSLQVPNLCSQPASYASSEGKANRQGTGRGGRCQSWIMGKGRSLVWNQWPTKKKGKRWSRDCPNVKIYKTRSCLQEDWSLRSMRESLRILIKRKTKVETLSIVQAHCGDNICFSFLFFLFEPFYSLMSNHNIAALLHQLSPALRAGSAATGSFSLVLGQSGTFSGGGEQCMCV